MQTLLSITSPIRAFVGILVLLGLAPGVRAAVVFSEDFTGQTSLSSDFTVTAGSGVTYGVSTSIGNPAPGMSLTDTGSNSGSTYVSGVKWSAFSTTDPGENIFRASFDWRVDSMATLIGSNSTMRVNLSLNATGSAAGKISLGFGHATIDGTDTNFFYAAAGSAAPVPSSANAIGYSEGSLIDGFNFGAYSSSTSSLNNTDDNFYRFTIEYEDNATSALLTVYNTANPSQLATMTITGLTPTSVSNTSSRNIEFIAPGSGTGTSYFDNIVIAAVPEPSTASALLGSLALGALLAKRRRRA